MNIIEKAVEKLLREKQENAPSVQRAAKDVVETPVPEQSKSRAAQAADVEITTKPAAEARPAAPESQQVDVAATAEAQAAAGRERASGGEGGAGEQPAGTRTITITNLEQQGVLTPGSERTRAAEEYRMIKRPLLTQAFSSSGADAVHRNLIMCTSAAEGEGKTFTVLNLAISIAMELDRTVLLVDADLAKPGLSRLLGVDTLPGLTDRLQDDRLDLKELLLHTDVPKLRVLPAGRRHHRSTELLASNNMRALLDELALRYPDRVVLFDSPPLLATSEAGTLAQQMGQICVVVESAVTPQYLVKEALGHIRNTANVSLILNKCKPDLFTGGYGYGYGYSYRYGQTGT